MKTWPRTVLSLIFLASVASSVGAEPALTPQQQASHVLNRLGFGPRPGDVERVLQMGVGRYIDMQLDPASLALPDSLMQQLAALELTGQGAGRTLSDFLAVRQVGKDEDDAARQKRRDTTTRITVQTAQARLLRAVESPRQLEEVMVDFWFNHFNVFSGKGLDRALVNSYERDAIRPNAMGRFRDLLGATAKHPAMLFYLDNWTSIGADVVPGRRPGAGPKARASGLNENYARELMELHTIGVDGGYSQKDVTELARMLTGWSFDPRALAREEQGFRFDTARHDVGAKEWLGHHVDASGQGEGEFALDVLASHPATAQRVSYQLAQYFVQDAPPPALVARLAKRFIESGGDIRAVLRTLFASPEFMAPAAFGAKFKTPYQFVVSAVRATGLPVGGVRPLMATLNQLGMPLYGCPTPDGYKNTQAAWLNPDAITRRIGFANTLASGRLALFDAPGGGTAAAPPTEGGVAPAAATAVDPALLLESLGSAMSAQTVAIAARNPLPLRASMLLGSPDFMQR